MELLSDRDLLGTGVGGCGKSIFFGPGSFGVVSGDTLKAGVLLDGVMPGALVVFVGFLRLVSPSVCDLVSVEFFRFFDRWSAGDHIS